MPKLSPLKILQSAVNIASNPIGAVGSIFSKKKKLKAGKTPASAGLVRRFYKNKSTQPKGKVKARGDGQGNQIMSVNHGKQHAKLNKYLETKIRDALNPMSSYIIQGTEQNNSTLLGQSTWSVWELGATNDIDNLLDKANFNRGSAGKIHIANASMELEITNQSTNLLNMKVYEYVARKDLPSKMGGNPTIYDYDTEIVVQNGWSSRPAGQYQADQHTIGATLYDNPLFTAYYKIVRVKNYVVGSGRTLKLSLNNNKDKYINPLTYFNVDTETEANYTRGFVFQCYGSMVGAPAPSDDGQTTTGSVGYDVFFRRKYHFNQPNPVSGSVFLTDNVPKTVAGGLPVLMNPATQATEYQNTA